MSAAVENITKTTPSIDFLVRLRRLDKDFVTPRDLLCLYLIMKKPGMSRIDLAHALNLNSSCNVLSNVNRLINRGFIEDRREIPQRASPSMLYILPKGVEYWESIKP